MPKSFSLHYDCSRLPAPSRRMLYVEVEPLAADLCLGIGGLNSETAQRELFFFALGRSP